MWKKLKLDNKKLPDKSKLLILLLIGLIIMVIAIPVSEEKTADHDIAEESDDENTSYESVLEEKLEKSLAQVKGVGKVHVMITLKSGSEKVIEKDLQSDSQTIEEEDSAGGSRMTKESSVTNTSIYEQYSDGSQTPYVSKELTPEVEGVIVIAEGGDDPVIVQDITEAVQALFHLEAHKIKIMKRNDS